MTARQKRPFHPALLLLVLILSFCDSHRVFASDNNNRNNAPVPEPAVRPATTTTRRILRKVEEHNNNTPAAAVRGRVKGVHQHQQEVSQQHRKLGEDKGGKTKPEKGEPDDDDEEENRQTPSPTPILTVMPTTTPATTIATKAPTTITPSSFPTMEQTIINDEDTTVILSLSLGVAPSRRRLHTTNTRILTPQLQSLVADTLTEILQQNNLNILLQYDESLVKSILFGVDVSWWLHNVTYQVVDTSSSSTFSVAQIREEANEALIAAMDSGELLTRLRESATQVLAVCEPGNELNTPLWEEEPDEDGGDGGDDGDVPRDFPGEEEEQEGPTHADSLSVSWQTRQWAGVGILATTLIGVMLLFRRSRNRREKLEHKVVWGAPALGTEQDVNNLLNIGWKSDGEEVTAVFNKEKENYKDDDSLLMGGIHQQSMTITNPSSASRSHTTAAMSQSPSHHTATSQ